MPFVVGENIGPYRILEKLGRGGMATVFKAYHAALDRYVAIKALHPAFMEEPNFHARFQREARVVAKLEHPNIVPIYDFAEYESRPYLVMKFIEGETLKSRLSKGGVEQPELLKIVEAIGAGLSYAHEQGILHRDVKPSNVLIADDDRVYLADFGLARIAQAGESTLSSDMMLGTPQYISPEQAMGLGELDERTDIYSFGVMLYEMAVGKVPFSADTPFSIIHDHIYTPLPLPRTVNPNVTEQVERVLLKALAKERDDRYPDAEALATAFQQAFSADPGSVPLDVSPTPEQTFVPDVEAEPEEHAIPAPAVSPALDEPQRVVDHPSSSEPTRKRATPDAASPIKAKRRRRFRWWFIPIGLILIAITCYCSFLALGALVDLTDNGRIDPPPTKPPPVNVQPDPLGQDLPLPELDALPLDEAQAEVDVSPDDPYAWLELAYSHWQLGNAKEARDALNKALELAGDDTDFYFDTAYELAWGQVWVDSARVYLQGIQRFYPNDVPEDIMEEFREAVYWAAEYPQAEKEIPISEIAKVDLPLERVAKARYLFYNGDETEAQYILDEVLNRAQPDMPEAMLLQAEMLYFWGETDAAINILLGLLDSDDAPVWMWEFGNYIIESTYYSLDDAQAAVDANPDDPEAYLTLYDANLAIGLYDEAEQAVQQALRLDGGDPQISNQAAEIAMSYGAWSQAARLYAYSSQLTPGNAPPELAEKMIQALYYSAADEGTSDIFTELENAIPDDDRGTLRLLYRDTLLARYKLYYEDVSEAQQILSDVLERAPGFPLAQLVQAEIAWIVGDYQTCQEILLELDGKKDLPFWMQEEVRYMLDEIKQ